MERPYSSAYGDEVVIPQEVADSEVHTQSGIFGGIFDRIGTDDLILIAVIVLLLTDKDSDMGTIAILAFLFLIGTDLL